MSIKQSLLHARINQLHKRLKHKIGMHDQREHGNWSKGPGMYGGEVYVPTGRRADFLSNRLNAPMNTLATIAQEETLFNITQRIPPKISTGTPSANAPMPIDVAEFERGGKVYEYVESLNIPGVSDIISKDSTTHEKMKIYFSNTSSLQEVLRFLYEAQSFNGKPAVVSWDEILNPTTPVKTDSDNLPLVFYRTVNGISDTDPEQIDRGMEYVEQMRTGDTHWPGVGVSGFGTYMKTSSIYNIHYYEQTLSEYLDEVAIEQRDENDESDDDFLSTEQMVEKYAPEIKTYIDTALQKMGDHLNQAKSLIYNNSDMLSKIFKDSSEYSDIAMLLEEEIYPIYKEWQETNVQEIIDDLHSQSRSHLAIKRYPKLFYEMSKLLNKAITNTSPTMSDEDFQDVTNFSINLKKIGTEYISSYNGLIDVPNNDRQNIRRTDLQITRNHYGKREAYSTGYTLNADARMPPMLVNKNRHGGSSAYKANSMDSEIINEFVRRYPMFGNYKKLDELPDTGVMMTILGWDAYYAHLGEYSTNAVILNRGILNVADTTIGPKDSIEPYI